MSKKSKPQSGRKPTSFQPTSVRIPPDLKEWVEEEAGRRQWSMSTLVVWILEQFRARPS